MSNAAAEAQRLYDRSRPEYTQAKGHNQRVKVKYPEIWAKSTITNEILTQWVVDHKGETCSYCDRPGVEIDHRVPLSGGGEHSLDNLQMLCLPCNRSKHDMSDEEYRAALELGTVTPSVEVGDPISVFDHEATRGKTEALFRETIDPTAIEFIGEPVFETIDELKRLYLDIGDPTEYQIAMILYGNLWDWERLVTSDFLKPRIKEWRNLLKAKIRSELVGKMLALARGNTSGSLAACRALLADSWLADTSVEGPEGSRPVGRPVKPSEIGQGIPKDILDDDAKRIGLKNESDIVASKE